MNLYARVVKKSKEVKQMPLVYIIRMFLQGAIFWSKKDPNLLQLAFGCCLIKNMFTLLTEVDIGQELILQPSQSITRAPQFQSPGALISTILPNVYVIIGIFLLFLLIFAGISIIVGTSSNDPKKAGQGQKAATAAVVGFIIVFASFWIIQIIAFITGIPELKTIFQIK